MNMMSIGFLAVLYLLLTVVTAVNINTQQSKPESLQRIRSWWFILVTLTISLLLPRAIPTILLGVISYLAFKEFLNDMPRNSIAKQIVFWGYFTIPIQYLLAFYQFYSLFLIFIPVFIFLFIPFRILLLQKTEDSIKAASTMQWGLFLTVFVMSNLAYIVNLPPIYRSLMTGGSLLIFLIFLTEMNTLIEAAVSKRFGKTKIMPNFYQDKTLEGLIGGVIGTILLAMISGMFLTVFSWQIDLIIGLLIGLTGFAGHLTMPLIRREIGIKEREPNSKQEKILTLLDSLTFTAPVFLYFVQHFYYAG